MASANSLERILTGILGICVAAVAVATVNALFHALKAPGPIVDGPSTVDDWATVGVGIITLLGASALLLVAMASGALARALAQHRLLVPLLGSALAFVLARDLTYDSYYGVGVRYIERGPVSLPWMLVLGTFVAMTIIAARLVEPRLGMLLGSGTLFACTVSAIFVQAGH